MNVRWPIHAMQMHLAKIISVHLNVNVIMDMKVTENYVLILMSVWLILITVKQDLDARTTSVDSHAKISMNVKPVMHAIRMHLVSIQMDPINAYAIKDMQVTGEIALISMSVRQMLMTATLATGA